MTRDISIDELNTYLYCGEYYKQYREQSSLPLYDDRTPLQIMRLALIKWLIAYKAQHAIVPSEEEVIIKIATARKRLEAHGHFLIFASQINDIHLSILEFRSFINALQFQSALSTKRYIRSGLSVVYPYWFTTDTTIYIPTHLPYRHALNSPYVLIPGIENPEKNIELLLLRPNTIDRKPIGSKLDIERADQYYTSILKGMFHDIYQPLLQCTKMSCPHYSECYIAR